MKLFELKQIIREEIDNLLSEGVKFHLNNKIPVNENIFRPGSTKYFELFAEVRKLSRNGLYKLDENEKYWINETDIGEFALYEGKKAGYFSGGSVDVGFNGAGFFQVKAWKGANSFEAAAATNGAEIGMSNVIGLTPGDSTASPPGLPADLAGLEAFSLTVVPEPGTIALAVLGLAAFFVRRRK